MARSRTEAAGFSLLEVLVATALTGLVLVVVLQVLAAVLQAQETSRHRTEAVLIAETVLQEYCDSCGRRDLSAGYYRGQKGPYAYLVQVETQNQGSPRGWKFRVICYIIQVNVSWEERGQTKSVELRTLRSVTLNRV